MKTIIFDPTRRGELVAEPKEKVDAFWRRIYKKMAGFSRKNKLTRGKAKIRIKQDKKRLK